MSSPEKKLFLLDAYALIFRAYYAFIKNPRINSKGLNTSAMLGFTNTLLEVLKKQKPSHIAVVFDYKAQTLRAQEHSFYKANRDETPEDIVKSEPYIREIIRGFNIPILESKGYEADDVIGTLAKMAEKEGFTVYMMTPDKDFGQLVSENIFMYKPARSGNDAEVMGIPEICEKFGVSNPLQVIDILGLWGDAVDNIPGVPGVGEKTAKKLIGDYGSIEGLYQNTHELKGKLKEKVEANEEQALISKKLATIILDVPVEFNEQSMLLDEPNVEALREVFEELEFRRLSDQLFGASSSPQAAPVPSATPAVPNSDDSQMDLFSSAAKANSAEHNAPPSGQSIETVEHQYHLVNTPEKRAELIELLNNQTSFCFDTETTGLDPIVAELVGMSFSIKSHEAYYVPIPEDRQQADAIASEFKATLENTAIEKIGQNIKYDMLVLKKYGIEVLGKIFDTMVAHYLIEPDMRRRSMDALAETYLNYKTVSITELIGPKGKNQKSMRSVSEEELVDYASEDADITLQLKEKFATKLVETNTMELFETIEAPLIPVLAAMESEGITLDTDSLKDLSGRLAEDIVKTQGEVFEAAGIEFNIASPKQVGEILFDHLKVTDKPKKTKTGQYATGEDVLVKLKNDHPIIGQILTYRELQKLKNTYVDTLPLMVNPVTGRIHTSYNQVVAATGRLSSDNPNLQNIPIRTERGREIRKAFVPRDSDHVLLSADYSQIELRIIAHLSQDKGMIQAFIDGEDIHAATASNIFGVPISEVTREMRSKAKAVNFGLAYGQGAFGLAQTLNIPRKEAKFIIDEYFAKYPGIKGYMESSVKEAKEHKFAETIKGRKRYLRDIDSGNAVVRGHAERNAINTPIQGSAADLIKIAMIDVHKAFQENGFQSKMVLQVHDELVFDVLQSELEQVKPVIEEKMKHALELSVPIEIDMDTGKNWLEAH